LAVKGFKAAPALTTGGFPFGERVRNMAVGDEKHTRLRDDPSVSDDLTEFHTSIVSFLTGVTKALDFD
jgi:hypothetical protein